MAAKNTKHIIILGAGFSVPANLPTQNKIISKMTEEIPSAFMDASIPDESKLFLESFIVVGLFLLENYGQSDYKYLADKYKNLHEQYMALSTLSQLQEITDREQTREKDFFNVIGSSDTTLPIIEKDDIEFTYHAQLYLLKNDVRNAIVKEGIAVSLEDVFTSFDKSMIIKEHLHKYTYVQMDEIRFAITSLFTYYFSKSVNEHECNNEDYLRFFNYIRARRSKEPTTIITTNWDTLIEKYCEAMNISYSYCFTNPYTSITEKQENAKLSLLKIHGSINWLRCLKCGGISVCEGMEAAKSLFNDEDAETCKVCRKTERMAAPFLWPEIITPTMLKAFSNQVYLNLWGTASRELMKATDIIFVGYSFPLADYDFRYMLQKSVPSDAKISVVLTESTDPKNFDEKARWYLPQQRYIDAFPKNKISFNYKGFGDFFK